MIKYVDLKVVISVQLCPSYLRLSPFFINRVRKLAYFVGRWCTFLIASTKLWLVYCLFNRHQWAQHQSYLNNSTNQSYEQRFRGLEAGYKLITSMTCSMTLISRSTEHSLVHNCKHRGREKGMMSVLWFECLLLICKGGVFGVLSACLPWKTYRYMQYIQITCGHICIYTFMHKCM